MNRSDQTAPIASGGQSPAIRVFVVMLLGALSCFFGSYIYVRNGGEFSSIMKGQFNNANESTSVIMGSSQDDLPCVKADITVQQLCQPRRKDNISLDYPEGWRNGISNLACVAREASLHGKYRAIVAEALRGTRVGTAVITECRYDTLLEDLIEWMEEHEYESIRQMRGSMSSQSVAEPAAFERANYMKVLSSYSLKA